MKLKLGRDKNGNKTLKVSFHEKGLKGFSVQTLGNLPRTHYMRDYDFDNHVAQSELNAYVKAYGTDRQKDLLGW